MQEKKYRLKKELLLPHLITGSGCTYGAGTILTESKEFPGVYKVDSGLSVVVGAMVEGNSNWFELVEEVLPVSNEGVGRIEVANVGKLAGFENSEWCVFKTIPVIYDDKFPAIKRAIEDVLNDGLGEHPETTNLKSLFSKYISEEKVGGKTNYFAAAFAFAKEYHRRMSQYDTRRENWGRKYTKQELDSARIEAFNAAREYPPNIHCQYTEPFENMKYPTISSYLSSLQSPVSSDKAEGEKEPLFVTEDGVKIYPGDEYWFMNIGSGFPNQNYWVPEKRIAEIDKFKSGEMIKKFSNEASAKDYILNFKPFTVTLRELTNIKNSIANDAKGSDNKSYLNGKFRELAKSKQQ